MFLEGVSGGLLLVPMLIRRSSVAIEACIRRRKQTVRGRHRAGLGVMVRMAGGSARVRAFVVACGRVRCTVPERGGRCTSGLLQPLPKTRAAR